jgi:hypothetical protein
LVRVVGLVLRCFSFLFHLAVVAFVLAASVLAWFGGHNLTVEVLPWQGAALTYWLFFSGLAGLLIAGLALKRILPELFVLWNVAVLGMLVRGYFFSSYGFGPGGGSLSTALCFVLAALVAAVGSWFHLRGSRRAW